MFVLSTGYGLDCRRLRFGEWGIGWWYIVGLVLLLVSDCSSSVPFPPALDRSSSAKETQGDYGERTKNGRKPTAIRKDFPKIPVESPFLFFVFCFSGDTISRFAPDLEAIPYLIPDYRSPKSLPFPELDSFSPWSTGTLREFSAAPRSEIPYPLLYNWKIFNFPRNGFAD